MQLTREEQTTLDHIQVCLKLQETIASSRCNPHACCLVIEETSGHHCCVPQTTPGERHTNPVPIYAKKAN